MHIRIDIPNEIIARSLKKAVDTGLKIHLSEVDIIFNTHDDTRGGIQLYDKLTENEISSSTEICRFSKYV